MGGPIGCQAADVPQNAGIGLQEPPRIRAKLMGPRSVIPSGCEFALAVRCAVKGDHDALIWPGGSTGFVGEGDLPTAPGHPQAITVPVRGVTYR